MKYLPDRYPELNNKRILFVCRETYSKPLWFLARDLSENNTVGAFYIMSSESTYNKCYYNEHTIYEFREKLPDVKLYDVADICDQFVDGFRKSDRPCDMDYLEHIFHQYMQIKYIHVS